MSTRKKTDPAADAALAEQLAAEARDNQLEVAIGHQVRQFRQDLDMTVAEVAKLAGLSSGMLSKIENGMTSPSLATLSALSRALNVPVTSFFRKFEEQRDATYVKAGEGLPIERRGTRAGHLYHLLGHSVGHRTSVEPYLITLTEKSEVFPPTATAAAPTTWGPGIRCFSIPTCPTGPRNWSPCRCACSR